MKYFIADTNLRNGDPINDMTGSNVPLTPANLAHRAIIKGLGYPSGRTLTALRYRQVLSGDYWMECSDDLWVSVEPLLTTAEALTVTSTRPDPWNYDVGYPDFTGFNRAKNIMAVTDSVGFYGPSLNTDQGYSSYVHDAVESLSGPLDTKNAAREFDSPTFGLVHMGIGGSYVKDATYTVSHFDMYEQCYQTMSLNNSNMKIFISLGTNDLSGGDSAATAWANLSALIALFAADFPLAKIVVATLIRRTEDAALNAKIVTLNGSIRANVANVFDAEAAHVDFSASSGDSTGTQYNADNTHLSAAGITTMAAAYAEYITLGGVYPELIADVDFSTSIAGWTAGNFQGGTTLLSHEGSVKLRIDNGLTGGNGYGSYEIATEVGKTYRVLLNASIGTAPAPQVRVGTTTAGQDLYASTGLSGGDNSFMFTATSTSSWLTILNASITVSAYTDCNSVSVRRL